MSNQSTLCIKEQLADLIQKYPYKAAPLEDMKTEIATDTTGSINGVTLEWLVKELLKMDSNLSAAVKRSGYLNETKIIVKAAQSEPDLAGFLANLYLEKALTPVSLWNEVHRRMATAFEEEGLENNVQKLNDALNKYESMYKTGNYYGKIVALAQSSAMGKSFTVAQLVKKKLGVNLCFREIKTVFGKGWPPQDWPICQFFRENESQKEYMGEELAAAFLGALFHVMHTQLAQVGDNETFNSYWKIPREGDPEASIRFKTLERVKTKAKALLAEYDRDELPKPMPALDNAASSVDWYTAVFQALVEPDLKELNAVNDAGLKHPHIVISLDECTELDKLGFVPRVSHLPQPTISVIAMRRIMKACDNYPCWFLLLDTNSTIPSLHPPPGDVSPSHRLREDYAPLPIWPYFDFDLMVEAEFAKGNPTPSDALALQHLKCYGRPYWSILNDSDLLDSAVQKLFCQTNYNASDLNQVFAALSARVDINLSNSPASNAIAATAVQRHVRILEGIEGRTILRSSAPSEPVLAIAAAHAMSMESAYRPTIGILVDELVSQSVIDRGNLGELICRLYLLMARDAVLITRELPVLDESYSVRTISLFDFFKTLLPDTCHKDLPADLDEYVINFTHFVSVTKNFNYLTPNFLFRTWCRGAAIQCAFPQPLFDNLVIAYRKANLSEPFDHRHCFIVAIQEKLRREASPLKLIDSITVPLVKSVEVPPYKLPHLVMLMDLGTTSSFGRKEGQVQIKNQPAESTPTLRGYYLTNEPPRMSINLRGHTADTYPFVRTLGPALLQSSIWNAITDASGGFPRYYDELIQQIDVLSRTMDEDNLVEVTVES